MPDDPLVPHSLAEAHLYVMATPCPSCGAGPLKGSKAARVLGERRTADTNDDSGESVAIKAACGACRSVTTIVFRVRDDSTGKDENGVAVINPTDEPSQILDVGQWIVLFRMITEAASKETDKIQARHLGIEGAQCLEEALKFYDEPGNDLPPPEALFTEASRERFRHAPEQFSRRRLIELRAKLPTMAAMRASLSSKRKRRWWRWRG